MKALIWSFLIYFSFLLDFNQSEGITNIKSNQNVMVEAAKQVVLDFYVQQSTILNLFIHTQEDFFLQNFIEKIGSSITIQVEDFTNLDHLGSIHRQFVVILIDDCSDFESLSDQMTSESFNPSGFFLITCLKPFIDDGKYVHLHRITEDLSRLFITNILIMIRNIDSSDIKLLTFFSYTKRKCQWRQLHVINEFNEASWTSPVTFPKKFKNFYNCTLTAASFDYPPPIIIVGSFNDNNYELTGTDVELLREISKVLNFTIKFLYDNKPGAWGAVYENGTMTGMLKKVKEGKADLMIGEAIQTMERETKHFSFSSSVSWSPLILVIPHGAQLSPLEKLLKPFSTTVWICAAALFSASFFCVFLLGLKRNE